MTDYFNIIRNINRRVDSIIRIFGMDSKEYNKIKSAIKKAVPDALLGEGEDGRIQIHNSKKVIRKATRTPYKKQRVAEQVREAFSAVKKLGTAREQAEKYTGKKGLSKADYETIRQKATSAYNQSKEEETFYAEVYSKLDDDAKDVLDKYWRAREGTRGEEAERLYYEAVEAVKQYIAEHQQDSAEDYIEESEETAEGGSLPASAFLGS